MDVGKISEEERQEIVAALQDRKKALGKLADATEKRDIPTDHIDERLALYTGSSERPGLLRLFGYQGELQDDKRMQRDPQGQQDIFGGGAETGGAPREREFDEGAEPTVQGSAITDKTRLLGNPPQVGALIRWPGKKTTSIAKVIRADGDGAWLVEDAEGTEVIVKKKKG
jgi:hypothetical protein